MVINFTGFVCLPERPLGISTGQREGESDGERVAVRRLRVPTPQTGAATAEAVEWGARLNSSQLNWRRPFPPQPALLVSLLQQLR